MQLVFVYGHAASGKLTVARALAARTGFALFHNHLVVDAVGAVFPFGGESFRRLRETWWLAVFEQAVREDRSLVFTFAPEPTVSADFPERVRTLVEAGGGSVVFVALNVTPDVQERRLTDPSRSELNKLRSLELLRELRPAFELSFAAMPAPALSIDTTATPPDVAASQIAAYLSRRG